VALFFTRGFWANHPCGGPMILKLMAPSGVNISEPASLAGVLRCPRTVSPSDLETLE
jgi:hypothetical protein